MYKIIGANQMEYGPVSADQIRQWIAEGRVNAQTSAQAEGETGWKPISAFPEFAASFPSTPVPPSFSPPPLGAPATTGVGAPRAREEVSGPAIGLMVVGGLGIAYGLWAILANLMGITSSSFLDTLNMPEQNREMLRTMATSRGVAGIFFAAVNIALSVLVLYGGLKMKDLEKYGLCVAASIISIIPCCNSPCCCVGIPIGIWALIVLNKPEVRDSFS